MTRVIWWTLLALAAAAMASQTLTDRVRSEFAERWGWLGDLVGL